MINRGRQGGERAREEEGPDSHRVGGAEEGPSHRVNTVSEQTGHWCSVCCGLGHGGGADSRAWALMEAHIL